MNIKWKQLILCLILPLGMGLLSTLFTKDSMEIFRSLEQPPLAPPGWLFPVVWTILYILMGLASYLVLSSGRPSQEIGRAWTVYFVQLMANFLWPILFFNFGLILFSFIWIVFLWILILIALILFYRVSKPAGYLLIPYLAWVTFAGYLNHFYLYLM